jgi:hypothetical protein
MNQSASCVGVAGNSKMRAAAGDAVGSPDDGGAGTDVGATTGALIR